MIQATQEEKETASRNLRANAEIMKKFPAFRVSILEVLHAAIKKIAAEYQLGTIDWVDETQNNAWSEAIMDFDEKFYTAMEFQDRDECRRLITKLLSTLSEHKSQYERFAAKKEAQDLIDASPGFENFA